MPRIRSIKPEFWADEDIGGLSRDARLLYIATWNFADDAGRIRWNPEYIKAQVFPYDPDMTGRLLASVMGELVAAGKVAPYVAGSVPQQLGYLPRLTENQVINRPQESKLPAPPVSKPHSVSKPRSVSKPHSVTGSLNDSLSDSLNDSRSSSGNRSHPEVEVEVEEEDNPPLNPPPLPSVAERFFDAFWEIYPRHTGKEAARRAWRKAVQRTKDPSRVLEGARRFAADPNLPEPQFIKHPATWLNAGCWDDEPLPPRPRSEQSRTERNVENINAAVAMVYGEEVGREPGRDQAHSLAPQRSLPPRFGTG